MIHRNVDSENDWEFGNGKQSYKKDINGVILNVKTRLQSWKYDSFSFPSEGVDYNNYLDRGTKNFLDADVKRVILQSEGIIKIKSYESEVFRDTRGFQVEVEVLTIYGLAKIEV